MRTKAWRLEQKQRMQNRARHISRMRKEDETQTHRRIQNCDILKKCGCPDCRNPRKQYGEATWKEKRQDEYDRNEYNN